MRFGKLTVIEDGPVYVNPRGRKARRWVCRCDCGNTTLVLANNVKRGLTRSCGCTRGVKSPPEVRFWERVAKGEGCWLWTGPPTRSGYGRIADRGDVSAHRFSWELHNGPIPEDLFVLHECDTPLCVRPDHLFLGMHADNMADMVRKGRQHRPSRDP